jgi:hypothetical protein
VGLGQLNAGYIQFAGGNPAEIVDDHRAVTNDGGAILAKIAPALAAPGYPDLDELATTI